jgi:hypothetical protein
MAARCACVRVGGGRGGHPAAVVSAYLRTCGTHALKEAVGACQQRKARSSCQPPLLLLVPIKDVWHTCS